MQKIKTKDEAEALYDLRKAVTDGANDEWLLGFIRQYPLAKQTEAAPVVEGRTTDGRTIDLPICGDGTKDGKRLFIVAMPEAAPASAVAEMEARKDAAYLERNQVVAALAKCFPSCVAHTAIEGWSEDWHGCVYIDLPTGQVSWHFHDSHASLFADLPRRAAVWDGHDTEEKYRRLAALAQRATSVPDSVEPSKTQPAAFVITSPDGHLQLATMNSDFPISEDSWRAGWTKVPTFYAAPPPQPDSERDAALCQALADGYESGSMTDKDLAGVVTLHYVSPACAENAFAAITDAIDDAMAAQQAKKD